MAEDVEPTEVDEVEDPRHSKLRDLGSYIRDQRESAKLSLRKLAKLAGVSNPYLSQIERGLRKPSAEILQAIAKALEISSETLYVKAGILEERGEDADLTSAIARDPHLTDPQRLAMIEMYRSFRQVNALTDVGKSRAAEADDGARAAAERFGELLEAISAGDVTDDDIARAASADEDVAEA